MYYSIVPLYHCSTMRCSSILDFLLLVDILNPTSPFWFENITIMLTTRKSFCFAATNIVDDDLFLVLSNITTMCVLSYTSKLLANIKQSSHLKFLRDHHEFLGNLCAVFNRQFRMAFRTQCTRILIQHLIKLDIDISRI